MLGNTNLNVNNRLSTSTTLTLNGGTVSFVGSNLANTSATQALGQVTLSSGHSTISSTKGSGGLSSLTSSAALIRSAGATANFEGINADLDAVSNTISF